MNVFDKKGEFQVNGKVTDLANNLITEPSSPMSVILDQTFGKDCFRTITVPVTNGFWEAKLWKFNDQRSFKTKVKLNTDGEYLKIEQHLDYPMYIESKDLFLNIQTVSSGDRTLAGNHRLRVVNALNFAPINNIEGEYMVTSKQMGKWKSTGEGDVFLDHLKVGLTNIILKNNPDYFNYVINGAKVVKGDTSQKEEKLGRSALLVPRTIDKEMFLTLTWIGKEFQLNMIAETFIDSAEGITKGEHCVLSFGQPKCKGMEHIAARERSVLGETIKINSNLFYDQDGGIIKDKRMLVYVMESAQNRKQDIGGSQATIGINLPEIGQLTAINVPFKTREEEGKEELKGVLPVNWAAMCMKIETNKEKGRDELIITRLNGLSVFKPNAQQLCGDENTGGF